MEIRGLDGVRGIENNGKVNKAYRSNADSVSGADSADISSEAKALAEESRIREMVDKAPDIRQDKVDEVREKLANGAYDNDEVMNQVAERLMKVLGL